MLAIGVNNKWVACQSKGSTGPPTYQIIKVPNANHMSGMKTSSTIIPLCPQELFSHYKKLSRLILYYKRIGPPWCTLFTFIACYSLQFILSQIYMLPTIPVLAEKTLLKTACNFLLLLVGFDTLTHRKDYDWPPILVGHQESFLAPLPGSEAPLLRKHLYWVLKFYLYSSPWKVILLGSCSGYLHLHQKC